jgi:CRISPR/Cas system-associated protein endoribonuclease Cas2
MLHINRVKIHLPADGEVRIIKITDKQFGRIEVFYGKKRGGSPRMRTLSLPVAPPRSTSANTTL